MVPCTDDDDDVLMVDMMMMALKPLHLIGGAHDDVALDDVMTLMIWWSPLIQLMHMVMLAMIFRSCP